MKCGWPEILVKESRNSTQDHVNHREHFQLFKKSESVTENRAPELTLHCICEDKGESSM